MKISQIIDKIDEKQLFVPAFQREYVWKTDDQVEQFLIDIDNEYDFNLFSKVFFSKSDKKSPVNGFMLIKTFPYCGGSKSSPPVTKTASVFG